MPEHYGLSQAQLKWLSGRSMPQGYNEGKERKRILKKSHQAWAIFIPVLRSKVVSQQFKDSLFVNHESDIHYGFDNFLKLLVQTSSNEPFEDIEHKLTWAKLMINYGFTFFQIRFKTNRLVNDKIEEIKTVLDSLDELITETLQTKEVTELYRQRKHQSAPPFLEFKREHWQSECVQCHSYAIKLPKSKKEAIENIQHDEKCLYLKDIKNLYRRKLTEKERKDRIDYVNFQYIRTISPKTKS